MNTYRVYVKGWVGYKEFDKKHDLRTWLERQIKQMSIIDLRIENMARHGMAGRG